MPRPCFHTGASDRWRWAANWPGTGRRFSRNASSHSCRKRAGGASARTCAGLDFLHDHALYRDGRRKLEVLLDPVLLPIAWDATWAQWKHLVGAKLGIDCPVVASGKYVFRSGEWKLVRWWTALPSRTEVKLPGDLNEQVERARTTYHRFGQYFTQLESVRQRLEREPVERRELDRLCGDLGIPGDFDVAQISWRPDYDPFYYEQLRKRARRMYLFRDEYIFELEQAIVVEGPSRGPRDVHFRSR